MANCLMQINQCGFPNCSQHFANQYDLTAHIEYTHIPMIEEDVKRKVQATSNSNGDTPPPVTNNLPLSYYSRVFRTAYRPNPIKPEPMKVSFNHYKKRALREKTTHPHHMIHRVYREMMARQGRNITIEEAEKRISEVDFDECGPENNEVRFRCHIVDCNKRYKNMFALRMHMKLAHAVVVCEEAKSLTNFPTEDVKPNIQTLNPPPQQPPAQDNAVSSATMITPTPNTPLAQGSPMQTVTTTFGNPATNPTSFKCTYCSKRYKTSSGLSNHMMSSHQKISDVQDAPSPQVVEQLISQARMQRQQQEQNNSDQSGQPRVSSSGQALPNFLKSASHVRSYTVTTTPQPLRFTQQHYQVNLDNQPSTGQVLQMQMQHQRRMKQIQEQQAAAAAAAAQQQQQQQQQQQFQPMGPPMPPPQSQQQPPQQQQQPLPPIQQQFHPMPPPQQPPPQQQQQPQQYPQQMHHMVQQAPMQHYQPQFQYQAQSQAQQAQPQQTPVSTTQRSPIPLSQSLPPLNSMTQQQRPPPPMQQMPNTQMHLSPPQRPNELPVYNMMTSPTNGPPMQQQPQQQPPAPPPPPYNM